MKALSEAKQQIEQLNRKVQRIIKLNNIYLCEIAERGKELEKLYCLFRGWKDQLPEALKEKMGDIFGNYIIRCTIEKTAKQMSGKIRQTA